jgi:predicted enzyme related to lactoylglutathione lyase
VASEANADSASAPPAAQLRRVLQPVAEIAAAVDFYTKVLGLPVRFVDGDRYAELDAGGAILALVAPEEDVAGVSAPSFKVADLGEFLTGIEATDAVVYREPEVGPHERRATITDPWGNRIVVYSPL